MLVCRMAFGWTASRWTREALAASYSPMTDQMKPMKMKMPAKSPMRAGTPTVFTSRFKLAFRMIFLSVGVACGCD